MIEMGTIIWRGQSGREYRYYSVYKIGAIFDAAPGNYVFAEEFRPGIFLPIYIGQTSDLSERFENHHAMPCIQCNQATHIHVHRNDRGEKARLAEEFDLIVRWDPPCNRTISDQVVEWAVAHQGGRQGR